MVIWNTRWYLHCKIFPTTHPDTHKCTSSNHQCTFHYAGTYCPGNHQCWSHNWDLKILQHTKVLGSLKTFETVSLVNLLGTCICACICPLLSRYLHFGRARGHKDKNNFRNVDLCNPDGNCTCEEESEVYLVFDSGLKKYYHLLIRAERIYAFPISTGITETLVDILVAEFSGESRLAVASKFALWRVTFSIETWIGRTRILFGAMLTFQNIHMF